MLRIFIVASFLVIFFGSNSAENSQIETNTLTKLTDNEPDGEELFINETLQLITQGDNQIILDDLHKELVLVVGTTGAGKTTISKFITDTKSLEAYDSGYQYLIRDKNQTISEKSTIVSKTIFPERLLDPTSNHVYYDMPGFSDTRNTSIEIANAWFMKKVADRASSVKILFIVSHSTLKFGQHRDVFLKLLAAATDFVKDPKKFADATSLIVSKVGGRRTAGKNAEDLIEDIADFLLNVKGDLGDVTTDPETERKYSDLIDAFLTKDINGTYTKISFFRQPNKIGPLTEIPFVMDQWSHMKQVIENNTIFVKSAPEDFGISVSPKGQLLSLNLTAKAHEKIASVMLAIRQKIQNYYTEATKNSPLNFVGTILQDFHTLESIPNVLNNMKERKEYFLNLMSLFSNSNFQIFTKETDEILKLVENIEFFENVSGQRLPFHAPEYTVPIMATIVAVKTSLYERLVQVNKQVVAETEKIARDVESGFDERLAQGESKSELREEMLSHAVQMDTFVNEVIDRVESFNQFLNKLEQFIHPLNHSLSKLTNDFDIKEQNCKFSVVMKLSQWLAPFKTLHNRLLSTVNTLDVQIHTETLQRDLDTKRMGFEKSRELLTKNIAELKLNISKSEIESRSESDLFRRRLSEQQQKCDAEKDIAGKLHLQKLKHLEELHIQSKSSYDVEINSEKQKGERIQAACTKKLNILTKNLEQEQQDHNNKLKELAKAGDEQDGQTRLFHTSSMQQAQNTCTNNLQNQDRICTQQLTQIRLTTAQVKRSFQDKQSEVEATCRATKQSKTNSCNSEKSSIVQQNDSEVKILSSDIDQVKNACDNELKNIGRNCDSQISRINSQGSRTRQNLNDELDLIRRTCKSRTESLNQEISVAMSSIRTQTQEAMREYESLCDRVVQSLRYTNDYSEVLQNYKHMAEDSEAEGWSAR
ncbi:unnamed protein product [Allacma fusca]|uniref:AIG1-type G domain-containing protein n=1 Tax=Allacma fusca TaxID=39272 RepID=A0A8J2JD34_9HEXA|nr:unnamed protein product [Allacma fusca]